MKPNIKARWLTALRSGEYQQGMNFLNNITKDQYCCLGVLCELAVEDGVAFKHQYFDGNTAYHLTQYTDGASEAATTSLPDVVCEWAGLYEEETKYHPDDLGKSYWNDPMVITKLHSSPVALSVLNDINEYSFEQIAQIIEDNL